MRLYELRAYGGHKEKKNYPTISLEFQGDRVAGQFSNGKVPPKWNPKDHGIPLDLNEQYDWADFLGTLYSSFVVSKRMKEFLEKNTKNDCMFLPFDIWLDKEGRKRKKGYYVVVCIGLVDAIDLSKTPHKVLEDKNPPDNVEIDYNFTLDRKRVPRDRKLFRLQHYDMVTIVAEELKKAIEKEKFTGTQFEEVPTSDRGITLSFEKVRKTEERIENKIVAQTLELLQIKPAASALKSLFAACRRKSKDPNTWRKLEAYDFDAEFVAFKKWHDALIKREPLPTKANALFFGVASPGKWKAGLALSLTAGMDFKAGWEYSGDVNFVPKKLYAPSKVLRTAGELACAYENQKPQPKFDWDKEIALIENDFAVAYSVILIDSLMSSHAKENKFKKSTPLHVLCGSTEGEYELIGALSRKGWIRRNPGTAEIKFKA